MFTRFENWYNTLREPYRLLSVIAMIACWDVPIVVGLSINSPVLMFIGFAWLVYMLAWGFWRNMS